MSGKRFALAGAMMASTAILGPMTAAERSKGRYMRAPDGHDDAEFAAFEAAGEVEVGKPEIETNDAPPEKPAKPAAKPAAKAPVEKPAAKAAADKAAGKGAAAEADADADADAGEGEGEGEEGDEEGDDEPEPAPKRKSAKERIAELTAKNRALERSQVGLAARLEAIEKGGLPAGTGARNSAVAETPAPDPTDAEKYPLGHLDDRYIEDKLDWLAEQKATKMADAALQREQGREQTERAQQAHETLLSQVDDLSTRGSELFDDFQESVVEAGLAGKWDLSQPTFEAAHEAEHGAQILYELAQDKKEASRVAKLSTVQQVKFVMDRDAELSKSSKPRTKPGAIVPPSTQTRGANSSARINPATDSLDDFEKAWAADEKANG
jgi:hypothetical protein